MLAITLQSLLSLSIVCLVGYPIVYWLKARGLSWGWLGYLALSWVIGLGIVTLWLLIASMVALSLRVAYFVMLAGALVIAGLLILNKLKSAKQPNRPAILNLTKWPWFDKLLIALVIFQIVFATVIAIYIPLNTRDAWANWGLKGKAFFIEDTVTFRNISDRHNYYPLLVPLSLTWMYLGFGEVNDQFGKLVFPATLLALVCIMYEYARLFGFSRRMGLLVIAYLLTSGGMLMRHASIAQADMTLGVLYTIAALAFLAWLKAPEQVANLYITGIGSALTLWTKHEGLPHVAILLVLGGVAMILRWKKASLKWVGQLGGFALIVLLGWLPWVIFRWIYAIPVDNEHLSALRLSDSGTILLNLLTAMLDFQRWGILWVVFFLVMLIEMAGWKSYDQAILRLLILGNLGFYVVAYLFTSHVDLVGQIEDTIHRLFLHILPLCVFAIALGIGPEFSRLKNVLTQSDAKIYSS